MTATFHVGDAIEVMGKLFKCPHEPHPMSAISKGALMVDPAELTDFPPRLVQTLSDRLALVALDLFDDGKWMFTSSDLHEGDPAPTHALIALELLDLAVSEE